MYLLVNCLCSWTWVVLENNVFLRSRVHSIENISLKWWGGRENPLSWLQIHTIHLGKWIFFKSHLNMPVGEQIFCLLLANNCTSCINNSSAVATIAMDSYDQFTFTATVATVLNLSTKSVKLSVERPSSFWQHHRLLAPVGLFCLTLFHSLGHRKMAGER